MRKRRNVFKSAFAILLTIATVLNTGFSTVASEIITDDGIVVNNDVAEEAYEDDAAAIDLQDDAEESEDIQIEVVSDNEDDSLVSDEELSDEAEDADSEEIELINDEEGQIIDEEEAEEFEEAEELKEGKLTLSDNGIMGSGYDEISIYVNTEKLDKKHNFRIEFNGPSDASYSSMVNDELDKTSQGYFDFTNLDGGDFSFSLYSSDDVILTYSYNEDGYPMASIESVDADKVLDTKAIKANEGEEVTAIVGSGYDSLEVEFVTDDLSDKAEYSLYVKTDAQATVDGELVSDKIEGLTNSTKSVTIDDLDDEEFTVYVLSDTKATLETNVSILSVEDGKVSVYLSDTAVKTVYEYEDNFVYVRATIEKADAIPDDAVFSVSLVDDTEDYLDALNAEYNSDSRYTDDNTLIYNISFFTDESKTEEIEPEEGSVSVFIDFKKNQLSDELGAVDAEDITVIHFEEDGEEIKAVELDADTSAVNDSVDFTVESFSNFAVVVDGKMNPGTALKAKDALGDAYYYGLVANEMTVYGHFETNFAVGTLHGNAEVQAPKNNGGGAGESYIGEYTGSHFQYTSNGNVGKVYLYTTADAASKFNSDMGSTIVNTQMYGETYIKNKVSGLINTVANKSASIFNEKAYKFSDVETHDGNNFYTLDIASKGTDPNGTYYITFEPGEYGPISWANGTKTGTWAGDAKGLTIKIKKNQTVVLNIPDSTVSINQFIMEIDGTSYTTNGNNVDVCEHVIFNCPNATEAHTNKSEGVYLFPKADYSIADVSAGWLVANNILRVGSQEWHCLSKDIPKFFDNEVTFDFLIKKNLVGTDWNGKKFTFHIEPFCEVMPGESKANGNKIKDPSLVPMPQNTTITIDENSSGKTQSFGSIKFKASEVFDLYNGKGSVDFSSSYTNRTVHGRCYMYKIWEEDPGEGYTQDGPWYLKLWVNAEQVGNKTIVWVESNHANGYKEGTSCQPGVTEFTNTFKEYKGSVQLEGTKKINGVNATASDSGKFNFAVYGYKGVSQQYPGVGEDGFYSTAIETVSSLDGNGTFKFSPIELNFNSATHYNNTDKTQATEAYYYYKVVETGCPSEYSKDTTVYIAKVTAKKTATGLETSVQYFDYANGTSKFSCKEGAQQNNGSHSSVMVFNNGYEATGEVTLYAKKVLNNRTLKAGEFEFTLAGPNGYSDKKTNDSDGNVKFNTIHYSLADAGKTYEYTVTETKGNDSTVQYDENSYTIKVSISDEKHNGQLTVKVEDNRGTQANPVVFTNIYDATGNIGFKVTKAFASALASSALANKEFTFKLTGDGITGQQITTVGAQTKSFEKEIDYKLSDAGKTFTYYIEEVRPAEAVAPDYIYQGVKYDPVKYEIKVTVSDNGSGKLSTSTTIDGNAAPVVDGKEVVNVTFTNDYTVKGIKTNITGEKNLVGKELTAGEFNFSISVEETEGVTIPNAIVSNKADKTFSFDDIEFTKAGVYHFTVKEIKGEDSNIQYSTDVFTVTVTVKDDNAGKLYIPDDGKVIKLGESVVSKVKFDNYYNATGEITLYAKKSISGTAKKLEANMFQFVLKQGDTVIDTKGNDSEGKVTFSKLSYDLSKLTLDEKGEQNFVYTISEVIPADKDKLPGFTYDATVHTVTVTVKDSDSHDGNLVVTADKAIIGKEEVVFDNQYNAEGEIVLGGTKELIGRKFTKEDDGKFVAVLYDNQQNKEIERVDIKKESNFIQDWMGNNYAGFEFSTIKYNTIGQYTYTVYEVDGSTKAENVTNDDRRFTVVVDVTDNYDGTLKAVATYKYGNTVLDKGIVFENTYDAEGKAYVRAKKSLGHGTLKDEFSFNLSGNGVDQTVTNNGSEVIFDEISYKLEDLGGKEEETFEYTLKEVNGGKKYYTYDDKEYTVKITVKDKGDGTLDATDVKYYYAGSLINDGIVTFENDYDANGSIVIPVKKTLNGRAITEANKFTFGLYNANGELVKLDPEGRVSANGTDCTVVVASANAGSAAEVKFPAITYTLDDLTDASKVADNQYVKYYTVKEIIPSPKAKGYVYDETVYNIVVTLTDDGKGEIEADWYAYKEGSKVVKPSTWDAIVEFFTGTNKTKDVSFVNEYKADGILELSAFKTFTNGSLDRNSFTFSLEGKDENGKVSQTKTTGADGTVAFDAIKFTKEGTYDFVIKETNIPKEANEKNNFTYQGITYDQTEYAVHVEVTDPGTGALVVNTTISASEKSTITATSTLVTVDGGEKNVCAPAAVEFINSYIPAGTTAVIEGTKVLLGRSADVQKDEFEFELSGGNLAQPVTTKTLAGGSFKFDELRYEFADLNGKEEETYTYSVKEIKGSDANITYTEQVYTVVVTIKDNHDGTMSADVAIEGANAIVFTNVYNAKNSLKLSVMKAVTGKKSPDNLTFKFELTGTGINKDTVEIKAGETGEFGLIEYSLDDFKKADGSYDKVKEYDYVVKEVSMADDEKYAGYEFDDTEYNVHVVVTNDGTDGTLTVESSVNGGAAVNGAPATFTFTNPYSAKGSTEIKGTKTLTGRKLDDGEFEFVLLDSERKEIARTSNKDTNNDGIGEFTFGGEGTDILKFTQDDIGKTFVYYVKEVVPADEDKLAHVDYDGREITVKVTVSDAGKGKLDVSQEVINGENKSVAFINHYRTKTEIPFSVTKTLTGRQLLADEFSFTLKQTSGGQIASFPEGEKTVKNLANGLVDFGSIEFNQSEVGDYEFEITENVPGDADKVKGVTYNESKNVYKAKVTVAVVNGELEANIVSESGSKTFINDFTAKNHIDLAGEKFLKGFDSDKVKKGEYTFILKDSANNVIATADVTGKGKYSFSHEDVEELNYTEKDLTYNAADGSYSATKVYTVVEYVPDEHADELVYATTVYTVTVKLGLDVASGTLTVDAYEASGAKLDELNFTNYYQSKTGWALKVGKVVTGKNLETGKYTFRITEVNKADDKYVDFDGAYTENQVNTGAETVFSSIEYNQDQIGKHYYKVEEIAATDGTEVDTTIFYVTVNVDVNEETQTLEATQTNVEKVTPAGTEGVVDVLFNNPYKAVGHLPLSGLKIMEGRGLEENEFTFAIVDAKGAVVVNDGREMIAKNVAAAVDEGKAEGSFTFPVMNFTEEDMKNDEGAYANEKDYFYTIVESEGSSEDCVTNSTEMYSLQIHLVNNFDGTITATPTIKKKDSTKKNFLGIESKDNDEITFTNKYYAEGEWDPKGYKELIGRDLKDGEFKFTITEIDQNGKQVKDHYYTVTNKGNTIEFSSATVKSESGDYFLKYTIDDLKDCADAKNIGRLYLYKLGEISQETGNGVKYDSDVYTITVRVTDGGHGKLNVQVDNSSILPMLTQKIKDANIEDKIAETDAIFAFVNEFNATGSIDLEGTKSMIGRDLTVEDDLNEYTFLVTEEGVENPRSGKVTNTQDAKNKGIPSKIEFKHDDPALNGMFNYDLKDVGTHSYLITEEVYNKNGVTYDQTNYRVTVEVSLQTLPDGDYSEELLCKVTGVEKITPSYTENFDVASGNYFEFANKFNADGEIEFAGTKKLVNEAGEDVGTAANLAGKYTMTMVEYTDSSYTVRKGGITDSVSTDAQGNFKFEKLRYNQDDLASADANGVVHKYYKVIESLPTRASLAADGVSFEFEGVVYDTTEYYIEVTFNDDVTIDADGNAKLDVKATVTNAKTGESVTNSNLNFTNKTVEYVTLSGRKYWHDNVTNASSRPDVRINLFSSAVGGGNVVINTYVIKAPAYEYYFDSDAAGQPLPAYNSKGKITYRVEEEEIKGYTSEKVGDDFHNTAGDILIRKVNAETGETLAGATLAILTTSGSEVERWVSTESAHVVTSALTAGTTYILREIAAPEGFEIADDVRFVVPSDGSEIVVTMYDTPIKGSVRLTKQDASTRAALAGAEFALYSYDGTRIYASGSTGSYRYSRSSSNGVFVTGPAGTLTISDLPYGSYYFVETKAPAGYVLSSERVSFSVTTNGELVEVTYLNTKATGSVRLRKINATGSRSLAGAVFELYVRTPQTLGQAATSTIFSDAYYRYGTYRTNAAGEIYVDGLPWDDYYFIEIEAPTGYQIATEGGYQLVYTFTIDSTATRTIDLGGIINTPEEEYPPEERIEATRSTTPSGVLGERRTPGGVMSDVLGVRAKPTSGVLGERVGPVTGDFSNIALWSILLLSCIAMIITMLVKTGKNDKKAKAKK